jgi:hypothetical protein
VSAFEVVAVVVSVAAITVALTSYFRLNRVLAELGRSGFDHQEERPVSDRPSEDEPDAPIPRRPLRGRPN